MSERTTPAGGGGVGVIAVRGRPGLRSLGAYLLSGEREHPAVAIARSLDADEPVLAPGDVRAIVGADPQIYYLPGEEMLVGLRGVLGGALALPAGGVRVWWPGLSVDSDPGGHPSVLALDGEPQASVLAQFAREFDLSRPRVRQEIRVIEDLRRLAERELSLAREENRNMKIERHDALMRAQAAEASLRDAMRQLEEMGK
ncbi:MAG TPA: hypothetical protein VK778_08445 [Solirubrobacteraceae bacterium]|nr:hypothetical protein [Solirubrobacteraceae bacterium]